MSKQTHFQATQNLLSDREALHNLVDTAWRRKALTRGEIYAMMGHLLDKDEVHISDMTEDEMRKIVEWFQPYVAHMLGRICHCCKHGYKSSLGLYRCELTGRPSITDKEDCDAFASDEL